MYTRAYKFEILACVFVGGVEFEGALIADNGFAEVVAAEICVSEVVPCCRALALGGDALLIESRGAAIVFFCVCRVGLDAEALGCRCKCRKTDEKEKYEVFLLDDYLALSYIFNISYSRCCFIVEPCDFCF